MFKEIIVLFAWHAAACLPLQGLRSDRSLSDLFFLCPLGGSRALRVIDDRTFFSPILIFATIMFRITEIFNFSLDNFNYVIYNQAEGSVKLASLPSPHYYKWGLEHSGVFIMNNDFHSKWKQGDVHSAFADLPDLRIRSDDYLTLFQRRDKLLSSLEANACLSDRDKVVFDKFQYRCQNCGSQMLWGINEHAFKVDDQWQSDNRLVWGNFCELNFCPVCAKKKSVRLSIMLNELMERLDAEGFYFFHMVLSDKSVPLSDLKSTVRHYNTSYNRLRTNYLSKVYDGAFVSLEYTLKLENDTVYVHPHFHVLLAASKSNYLSGKTFCDWEELRKIWARSLKIPRIDDPDNPKQLVRDKPFEYLPFSSIYQVKKHSGEIFSELTKYLTDYDKLLQFLEDNPGKFSFADFYESFTSANLHRGSGVLAFSSKNLHFVQCKFASAPEYIPEFFALSRLSKDRSYINLEAVVRSNDVIRIDDDGCVIAPVKCVISTYVRHQAYFYGFNFNKQNSMHVPEWWENLAIKDAPPSNKGSPKAPLFKQFSIFDL